VKPTTYAIACSLVFVTACSSNADQKGRSSDAIPPEQFVQRFYDWYSPLARESSQGRAWNVVLNDSSALLSAELATALRTDSASQAATTGEIAGIDFDPFLNSQDPCEQYSAGLATRSGEDQLVEVYAVCGGAKGSIPDAIMELQRNDKSWVIRNVRYPNINTDLLTVLRAQQSPTSATTGSGDGS
jgi:hypothetical protein